MTDVRSNLSAAALHTASRGIVIRILGVLASLGLTVLIARLSPVEIAGTVLFFLNTVVAFGRFGSLGTTQLTMRRSSGTPLRVVKLFYHRASLFTSLLGNLGFAVMLAGVLTFFPFGTAGALGLSAWWFVPLFVSFGLLIQAQDFSVAQFNQVPALFAFQVIRNVVPTAIVIGWWLLDAAAFRSILPALLAIILGNLAAWAFLVLRGPPLLLPKRVQLRRYGRVLLASQVFWWNSFLDSLTRQGAGFVLGLLFAPEAYALFVIAQRVAMTVQVFLEAVRTIALPFVSAARRSAAQLATVCRTIGAITFYLSFPIAVVIFLAGYPILLVFGRPYAEADLILKILIGAECINALLGPVHVVAQMLGLARLRLIILAIATTALFAVIMVSRLLGSLELAALGVALATVSTTASLALALHYRRQVWAGFRPEFLQPHFALGVAREMMRRKKPI